MYLKEALLRCARLEDEVASVYDRLANSEGRTAQSVLEWAENARLERTRATLLRALAAISTALGDDGPFLVDAPVQLAGLDRVLEMVRRRMVATLDAAASAPCIDALEFAPLRELHAALLETAEPELKRALRRIDSEVRALRRASQSAGSRSKTRRESCALTAS